MKYVIDENRTKKTKPYITILITPMRVFIFLLIIIFILCLLGFFVNFDRYIIGNVGHAHMLLYAMYNLDGEANIPTAFSAIDIAFSSVLLFFLYKDEKAYRGRWYFHYLCLGLVFLFLSCDEVFRFHEQISDIVSRDLHTTSPLVFGTVLFAMVMVPLIVVFYWRWLLVLPLRVSLVMIFSAAIYLLGAVGVEVMGISYAMEVGGKTNLTYQMFALIEETLEMIGIAIFNYALLKLLLWQERQRLLSLRPYATMGAESGWVLALLKPGETRLLPGEEAADMTASTKMW
jgi:hypothetical protein